jgi:hypothetical protein
VLLRGEAADVHTDFRQNHQGGSHVDPRDQGQVHAQGLEQRVRRLEPDVVVFPPRLARLGGPTLFAGPVRQAFQFRFNPVVALGDLLVMEMVQIVRLPQLEEMFGPPRSLQRQCNLIFAGMTASIPQCGQFGGVVFAVQDGLDDQHAGQTRDGIDDFRQFDVHLLHGLLHVLDVTGGVAHLHLPLPPVGT